MQDFRRALAADGAFGATPKRKVERSGSIRLGPRGEVLFTSVKLRRGIAVILTAGICAVVISLIIFLAVTDDPLAGLRSIWLHNAG